MLAEGQNLTAIYLLVGSGQLGKRKHMDFILVLAVWIGLAILIGNISDNRGQGFAVGFAISLIASPLIALLVIIAMKDRSEPVSSAAQKTEAPAILTRQLSNPQYKVWLVEKYNIQRNDVLGEIICGSESFGTIDEALAFAHQTETALLAHTRKIEAEKNARSAFQIDKFKKNSNAATARLMQGNKIILYADLEIVSKEDLLHAITTVDSTASHDVVIVRNGLTLTRTVRGGTLGLLGHTIELNAEDQRLKADILSKRGI